MRIGYPCINTSIACRGNRTFRLSSYSRDRLYQVVGENLRCLYDVLSWNAQVDLLFFRISSDIVPFASHPVCSDPWDETFAQLFAEAGDYVRENSIRISMHPDQFIILNSPDQGVTDRSIAELSYHALVLDLMGLRTDAKIQIHVGGKYGDRQASISRFVDRVEGIDPQVRRRLVVENDDSRYTFADCLEIYRRTGLPVLFDTYHHSLFSNGETIQESLVQAAATWRKRDGILMVDYSSPLDGGRRGSHAEHIDPRLFSAFLEESSGTDFDVMLEIKDKEKSARTALALARGDPRLIIPEKK